jgi:hypothetical protein
VGVKRTFGVFIQNSKEYLEFGYRIYRGFIRQSSQPGYLVKPKSEHPSFVITCPILALFGTVSSKLSLNIVAAKINEM